MQRWFTGALVLGGLLLSGANLLRGQQNVVRPRVTVLACDKVGLDREVGLAARDAVVRIWEATGVEMVWINATGGLNSPTTFDGGTLEHCEKPSQDLVFNFFVVLSRESNTAAPRDALGFAQNTNRRIYVFNGRVDAFIEQYLPKGATRKDKGAILGHAIAHELGHLVLRGENHSAKGIMSSNWTSLQAQEALAGALLFQLDQSQRIRTRLTGLR